MTRILQITSDIIAISETGDFTDTLDLFRSEDDGGWSFYNSTTDQTSKTYPSVYNALRDYRSQNGKVFGVKQ